MTKTKFRIASDSMGRVTIPVHAYWGPQTQRAIENFAISGKRFPEIFIYFLGLLKMSAARQNRRLGLLEAGRARAIEKAAREVMAGKWRDHFIVDVFQTGSGTSINMNANEVIARRAAEILREQNSAAGTVHANDHVNLGQSSNDVVPTCIHLAVRHGIEKKLLPELQRLQQELAAQARKFSRIVKLGRTHLQDALPVTLGQEFGGYAAMMKKGRRRLMNAMPHLAELALGGTAVGTGFNSHPAFAGLVIGEISRLSGMKFKEAEDHFEAQGSRDALVETSAALRGLAVSLFKIANDIRWLASGPRGGIGEIRLPAVQPGSSMMPGKINPVMAEALLQACAQVMGNDAAVSLAGASGNFELNVMMPMMALNLLESVALLANGSKVFRQKCLRGIVPDQRRCRQGAENSLALATVLVPLIGYDRAAAIAQEAYREGKTIAEVCREKKVIPAEKVNEFLDPGRMIFNKKGEKRKN